MNETSENSRQCFEIVDDKGERRGFFRSKAAASREFNRCRRSKSIIYDTSTWYIRPAKSDD